MNDDDDDENNNNRIINFDEYATDDDEMFNTAFANELATSSSSSSAAAAAAAFLSKSLNDIHYENIKQHQQQQRPNSLVIKTDEDLYYVSTISFQQRIVAPAN